MTRAAPPTSGLARDYGGNDEHLRIETPLARALRSSRASAISGLPFAPPRLGSGALAGTADRILAIASICACCKSLVRETTNMEEKLQAPAAAALGSGIPDLSSALQPFLKYSADNFVYMVEG